MQGIKRGRSDHRAVGDDRVLRDDDDLVANVVRTIRRIVMLDAFAIDQLNILSDAYVLIDDRISDDAVLVNTDVRDLAFEVVSNVLDRFKDIGAHHDRILDHDAFVDARPQADDRILDRNAAQDAAFTDHRIIDRAIVDL